MRECLDQTVLAQLALARHLIPLLAEAGRNGRYVIIGGPGSEAPWAGYGLRSVAMAATRMLAQVLHDEAQPLGVRVHLVSIDAPVRRDEPGVHECPEWPTVSGIARRVTQLLDAGRRARRTRHHVRPQSRAPGRAVHDADLPRCPGLPRVAEVSDTEMNT